MKIKILGLQKYLPNSQMHIIIVMPTFGVIMGLCKKRKKNVYRGTSEVLVNKSIVLNDYLKNETGGDLFTSVHPNVK